MPKDLTKTVWVDWDEIYGPIPYFAEDKPKHMGGMRQVAVNSDTYRRWKRVKKDFFDLMNQLEDQVER